MSVISFYVLASELIAIFAGCELRAIEIAEAEAQSDQVRVTLTHVNSDPLFNPDGVEVRTLFFEIVVVRCTGECTSIRSVPEDHHVAASCSLLEDRSELDEESANAFDNFGSALLPKFLGNSDCPF